MLILQKNKNYLYRFTIECTIGKPFCASTFAADSPSAGSNKTAKLHPLCSITGDLTTRAGMPYCCRTSAARSVA